MPALEILPSLITARFEIKMDQKVYSALTYRTGIIGFMKQSAYIIDVSFDILSLAALFLVPRIFSIFSLNPYFGSLVGSLLLRQTMIS